MPYPTFEEARLYKAPFKMFDIRISIRLDYPLFDGHFRDDFDGTVLDSAKWDKKVPSWGVLTVSGGTALCGVAGPAISPAWFSSKPNITFPKDQNTNWTMEARVKFPNIYGNGVFFRVCSLEARDAVLAVKCNLADGLTVEGPDQQTTHWSNGVDYGWHTYKLTFTANTKMYEVFVDGVSEGTYSAVGYRADYIVVGNSVARQGLVGDWTEIEVDYVDVTGTAETMEIPNWAGPMYLYDYIGYDNELWAYLPLWERGRIDIHKKNTADALWKSVV